MAEILNWLRDTWFLLLMDKTSDITLTIGLLGRIAIICFVIMAPIVLFAVMQDRFRRIRK